MVLPFIDNRDGSFQINKDMIPLVLRQNQVPEELIVRVIAPYHTKSTRVRACSEVKCFGHLKSKCVLNQGSALSLLLFTVLLDCIQ